MPIKSQAVKIHVAWHLRQDVGNDYKNKIT